MLSVTEHEETGVVVVSVQGELDVISAPTLAAAIDDVERRRLPRLVVDLSDVRFIDSAGINALVSARHRVEIAGGELVLVCVSPAALRLFQITQLDQVFAIFGSLAAAIAPTSAR